MNSLARFQILSLIGGGIRGAFVVSYLRELEQQTGRPIAESFDLIAGTSTGGIIAAGLALGLSTEDLFEFYTNHGAKIFSPRERYRAKGIMRFIFPLVSGVFKQRTGGNLDAAFRARFCPFALQDAFDIAFGDSRLRDILKTRLIIPTVNLTDGEPHVFRSRHLPKAFHDQDVKVSDVVIAATAAPRTSRIAGSKERTTSTAGFGPTIPVCSVSLRQLESSILISPAKRTQPTALTRFTSCRSEPAKLNTRLHRPVPTRACCTGHPAWQKSWERRRPKASICH